jgi:aromatic-L-amino-acid decarboxylase
MKGSTISSDDLGDIGTDEFRAAAHRAVEWVGGYLDTIRERPVAPPVAPGDIRRLLPSVPPERGEDLEAILRDFEELILPGITHWNHPRFFGYFGITGSTPGILAELLIAALNVNAMLWRTSPAATELEEVACDWLRQAIGLGPAFSGVINDTASSSTLYALTAAREAVPNLEVRRRGMSGQTLRMYVSEEAHSSVEKAGIVLGVGQDNVVKIATDPAFRMDVDALSEAIRRDRKAGHTPFAVVATVGTTSVTAVDPVPAVAGICAEEKLWLHVDAAYGGAAALAPELRPLLRGIERADSIAFDPHKWLYTPQSSACLLVRDPRNLLRSYSIDAAYVRDDASLSGRGTNIGELGPQWSRAFLALKVWLSLAAHGTEAYGRRIAHDVELARYLDRRVREHPDLEPMCPVTLSIACFRYAPAAAGLDPAALDALNERLMVAIRRDGRAFPSNAELGGRYCLRACLVNHRTEARDVDALVDATVELGARMLAS